MRLAFDSRVVNGPNTGDRTVWLGLLRGLLALEGDDQIFCITDRPGLPEALAGQPRLQALSRTFPPGRLWIEWAFPQALRQIRAQVGLVTYNVPHYAPCPVVTAIHDVVWRSLPETFPADAARRLEAFIPGSIRRAAAVLTGTHFAEQEILRYYPHAAGKVHVIPWGIDEAYQPVTEPAAREAVRARYGLPQRFILSVGVLQPRKNIERLLDAYGQLPTALRREVGLVITGKRGWLDETISATASRIGGTVLFTGYVEDAELPVLYSLATCVAYPSLYEGFGLPPLEAMACGTPVLTSNTSSLPEATGGAALLVDPSSSEAIAAGLERLLTDEALRGDLVQRGLTRARELTWEKAARRLREILQGVVGE